jgi:mono/diheme cytochrome c family protein
MKRNYFFYGLLSCISLVFLMQCNTKSGEMKKDQATAKNEFGGFGSQIAWGEHIVKVSGCNDCHTPKKMTLQGPDDDTTLLLSGHPEKMPPPDVDRKAMEKKGLTVTSTLTAWVGPWGISYAANLTSDATGIGNWQESNFITAIRDGKYKGIAGSRNLLPPMPWQWYRYMSDDELKAVFAYLKSTKPVRNVVPAAEPPMMAMH